MSIIRPFPGLRPPKDLAEKVASPPYDVLNSEEAREMAKKNPESFLHVNKPEIDLPPDTNPYADEVYAKGRENLRKFIDDGILIQDDGHCFYLYAQTWNDHRQVGLVTAASVQEYIDDKIKKHEHTREEKEKDRIRHIEALGAQVGPVFLTYLASPEIDAVIDMIQQKEPEYDFTAPDGIQHTFWVISSKRRIEMITRLFDSVPLLYVADGHHRSASATIIAQKRREANPDYTGAEPWNFFLTVLFPHNQLKILSYNRVVKDLNENSIDDFIEKVEERFFLSKADDAVEPDRIKLFGMYLSGKWYRLEVKPEFFDENDPVNSLDVALLQNNLLSPILGIEDPRKDKRIDFVGGIRGTKELEKRVDSGEMQVAFSLHATTIEQLIAIADAGEIMPPKSTWFEPKLRSGLVIHQIE
ncbi:MAG: DUF1015 family protein [Candidatus Electryonea clarkiae]|nr:DUF1015 family protein [Candidatus Electryonea clarkiae]MDP8285430.1 DUF1015 family protein [Candidatus Electryonea clarkiae]